MFFLCKVNPTHRYILLTDLEIMRIIMFQVSAHQPQEASFPKEDTI